MSMSEFTIDHARMGIITKLNRYGDDFSELKKEIFYYDEKLKCFTTKKIAVEDKQLKGFRDYLSRL